MTSSAVPNHIAIVMDGNGRWATRRYLPRVAGHKKGVDALRACVRHCGERGVRVLTVFAFSSENWNRPPEEVSGLMELLAVALAREVPALKAEGVRIRFIGDHGDFPDELRRMMADAEALTLANTGLNLVIAVGYGGQWDIAQAASSLCRDGLAITPQAIESRLAIADLPHPDLLIRTGGEKRLSNFLIWQLAYTELHLIDTLWPDFDDAAYAAALAWYASRERRFGRVPEAS